MIIRPMQFDDLAQIKIFTDIQIGKDYFTTEELLQCYNKAMRDGVMYSFLLVDKANAIHGVRLSYPPGAWSQGKGTKLSSHLWRVAKENVAYFQSLFISAEARGAGWGPKLSEMALEQFRKINVQAVVTHAWSESPNNSSVKYLEKFGFTAIATHPEYWINVNYECVRDGKPCRCTAIEMIKYL